MYANVRSDSEVFSAGANNAAPSKATLGQIPPQVKVVKARKFDLIKR